jgi:hypothetical protein
MIVFTFDVLAYSNTDKATAVGARQPIPEGQKLYESLYHRYHGKVIILGDGNFSAIQLSDWAKREGYKFAYADVTQGTGPEAFRDKLRDLNAAYGKIDFFVDTNPETITLVMKDAIPCLLMALPQFVRPEWRDNKPKERKVWDELARELEVQSLYRSTKDTL